MCALRSWGFSKIWPIILLAAIAGVIGFVLHQKHGEHDSAAALPANSVSGSPLLVAEESAQSEPDRQLKSEPAAHLDIPATASRVPVSAEEVTLQQAIEAEDVGAIRVSFNRAAKPEDKQTILEAAAYAIPELIEPLLQDALRDPSPTVRRAVVDLLPELPEADQLRIISQAIRDTHPEVKDAVEDFLNMADDAFKLETAQAVIQVIADGEPVPEDTRLTTIEQLTEIYSTDGAMALLPFLEDEVPAVRLAAADAYCYLLPQMCDDVGQFTRPAAEAWLTQNLVQYDTDLNWMGDAVETEDPVVVTDTEGTTM